MSVAKTTVDKLLKGYDIRLRPDFGGTCGGCTYFGESRIPAAEDIHKGEVRTQ